MFDVIAVGFDLNNNNLTKIKYMKLNHRIVSMMIAMMIDSDCDDCDD